MRANSFFRLAISLVLPLLAGFIGSFFTASAIQSGWYAELAKPALNPPSWVFAPVWTTLYVLMGIALFLVWRKGLDRREVKIALSVFFAQLILNALWSIIFFGLRSPGLALVEIAILWIAIIVAIIAFAKVSKIAAWLLAPYILWVSFALYLNYAIWIFN